MEKESERERVLRARKDPAEFDSLYREYFPKINSFVFHRVPDEETRREVVSNVFYKAMKGMKFFSFIDSRKRSFSSWLYRIAVNEINQFYRNRRREEKLRELVVNDSFPEPAHYTDDEPDYEAVKKCIRTLPVEEQNLIVLRFFEKLSYRELAEIFNKKEGALKVRMFRTLGKLRKMLVEEPAGENV